MSNLQIKVLDSHSHIEARVRDFNPARISAWPRRGPKWSGGDGRNGLIVRCTGGVGTGPAPGAISVPVFLDPLDDAKNFSTVASSRLYPGQSVSCRVRSDSEGSPTARLYVLYLGGRSGTQRTEASGSVILGKQSSLLEWKIPPIGSVPLVRLGLLLEADSRFDGRVMIEEVDWQGAPSEFEVSGSLMTSIWERNRSAYGDGSAQLRTLRRTPSTPSYFPIRTTWVWRRSEPGDWSDYSVTSHLWFSLHASCGLVLRSVGHRRFYAAIFEEGKRLVIVKHRDRDRTVLVAVDFPYEIDEDHIVRRDASERNSWLRSTVSRLSRPTTPIRRTRVGPLASSSKAERSMQTDSQSTASAARSPRVPVSPGAVKALRTPPRGWSSMAV